MRKSNVQLAFDAFWKRVFLTKEEREFRDAQHLPTDVELVAVGFYAGYMAMKREMKGDTK